MATAELLIDTDVLIDHLRGHRRLRAQDRRLAVSVITCCELFAGRGPPGVPRELLDTMLQLPVDTRIAELAGATRRRHQIAISNALIAATALVHRLPLMTCNHRHFQSVQGLEILTPA